MGTDHARLLHRPEAGTAQWIPFTPAPPGATDTQSIELTNPDDSPNTFAGAELEGVDDSAPATAPSFWYYTIQSGPSGGSPAGDPVQRRRDHGGGPGHAGGQHLDALIDNITYEGETITEEAPATCDGLKPTITGSGRIVGTGDDDVIISREGPDRIIGGGGDDVICGLGGGDVISAKRAAFESSAGPAATR